MLAEDVQFSFGTKVLPAKMTLGKLIDKFSFVEHIHELTYNMNRVAARLRMQKEVDEQRRRPHSVAMMMQR